MANEFLASGDASAAPAGGGAAAPVGNDGGGLGVGGGAPPPTPSADPAGSTPAPAATPGTLASGDAPPTPTAPQSFPDDWRQKMAGDDKAFMKTLERFPDPTAFAKSFREMQAKIGSGQLKPAAPGDNASPEELATWRKENGIPEAPDGYLEKLALPNGMVPGEADKPILAEFAKAMHARNAAPEVVNEAVKWYYESQDAQAKDRAAADFQAKTQAGDELNRLWGGEYRANINSVDNLLTQYPDVKDRLLSGRTGDGKIIGNDPAVLKMLAGIAREINPMGAHMPAGTTDAVKGGEARIREIENLIRTDPNSYWKNPETIDEYGGLLEAREKMQARGR